MSRRTTKVSHSRRAKAHDEAHDSGITSTIETAKRGGCWLDRLVRHFTTRPTISTVGQTPGKASKHGAINIHRNRTVCVLGHQRFITAQWSSPHRGVSCCLAL